MIMTLFAYGCTDLSSQIKHIAQPSVSVSLIKQLKVLRELSCASQDAAALAMLEDEDDLDREGIL